MPHALRALIALFLTLFAPTTAFAQESECSGGPLVVAFAGPSTGDILCGTERTPFILWARNSAGCEIDIHELPVHVYMAGAAPNTVIDEMWLQNGRGTVLTDREAIDPETDEMLSYDSFSMEAGQIMFINVVMDVADRCNDQAPKSMRVSVSLGDMVVEDANGDPVPVIPEDYTIDGSTLRFLTPARD